MSRFILGAQLNTRITIELTEDEFCALNAIAGYGADHFLKVFYEKMGSHYLRPHEAGLRSLFHAAYNETAGVIERANDARKVFNLKARAIPERMIPADFPVPDPQATASPPANAAELEGGPE
jgi:hypothetical protein